MKKAFSPYSALWLLYVFVALIVGEFHPFSRYMMYNAFPDEATVVYVADSSGGVVPLKKYFRYKSADLTHNFHAYHHHYTGSDTAALAYLWRQLQSYSLKAKDETGKSVHQICLKKLKTHSGNMRMATICYDPANK